MLPLIIKTVVGTAMLQACKAKGFTCTLLFSTTPMPCCRSCYPPSLAQGDTQIWSATCPRSHSNVVRGKRNKRQTGTKMGVTSIQFQPVSLSRGWVNFCLTKRV